MPATGTKERLRAKEWLNYIATELHKGFGVFFNPNSTEEQKKQAHENLTKKFALPGKALDSSEFLLGSQITAPDFYLYVILTWAQKFSVDLSKSPSLMKFAEKMKKRDSVQETMKMEGLH